MSQSQHAIHDTCHTAPPLVCRCRNGGRGWGIGCRDVGRLGVEMWHWVSGCREGLGHWVWGCRNGGRGWGEGVGMEGGAGVRV